MRVKEQQRGEERFFPVAEPALSARFREHMSRCRGRDNKVHSPPSFLRNICCNSHLSFFTPKHYHVYYSVSPTKPSETLARPCVALLFYFMYIYQGHLPTKIYSEVKKTLRKIVTRTCFFFVSQAKYSYCEKNLWVKNFLLLFFK